MASDIRAHVIFDGNCGFCTRSVNFLRRLDRHRVLAFHAFQEPHVLERFDLTLAEAQVQVWTQRGPELLGGAAAVNAALDEAVGTRIFTWIYRFAPMRAVQEAGYRWVAQNRHRLGGVIPWCEAEAGRCSELNGA